MLFKILLFIIPAFSQEAFKLLDGTEVFGYHTKPPIKALAECDRYALVKKGKSFEFLGDGIKKVTGDKIILVRKGCLHPFVGKLELDNGKFIDFYQEQPMNVDGQLAFWSGTSTPVPDGKYQLKKGTKFEINKGLTDDYGVVCGNDICFENRD